MSELEHQVIARYQTHENHLKAREARMVRSSLRSCCIHCLTSVLTGSVHATFGAVGRESPPRWHPGLVGYIDPHMTESPEPNGGTSFLLSVHRSRSSEAKHDELEGDMMPP